MKKSVLLVFISILAICFHSCASCESNSKNNEGANADSINEDVIASNDVEEMEDYEAEPDDPPFEIEAVDLGLSVLWANANIGATSVDDIGYYLAWGESQEKSHYDLDNYFDFRVEAPKGGMVRYIYDKFNDEGASLIDTEYDTAAKILGGKWRMPTSDEFRELANTCKLSYDYIKDKNNKIILTYVSATGPNGNSIIFPLGGYKDGNEYNKGDGFYWTANLPFIKPEDGEAMAGIAGLNYRRLLGVASERRCYGLNVRAVMEREASSAKIDNGTYNMEGRLASNKTNKYSITIEDTKVIGEMLYQTASSNEGYRLEGTKDENNNIILTQYNHLEEVVGRFDGAFDGMTYRGKYRFEDGDKEFNFRFTVKK